MVEGDIHQVVAARDQQSQTVVGFGARNVRTLYVNGREQAVGYLSTLRLLKDHRNIGLIARGYAKFRQLHEDGQAPYYLTTIAEGNKTALRILTSGRAGLPQYQYLEDLHTFALSMQTLRRLPSPSNIAVRPLNDSTLPAVLAFWQREGRRRQFFPHLEAHRFASPQATYRDLALADIQVAWRNDQVVGTFGIWNQSGFRQSVVQKYSAGLAWSRPVYNVFAALSGRPQLPAVGHEFHYCIAALVCVQDFNRDITRALIAAAAQRAPKDAGDFLLLGLPQSDPLNQHWQQYSVVTYTTRIYLVAWDDAARHVESLAPQPLYLELGCL